MNETTFKVAVASFRPLLSAALKTNSAYKLLVFIRNFYAFLEMNLMIFLIIEDIGLLVTIVIFNFFVPLDAFMQSNYDCINLLIRQHIRRV